MQKYDDMLRAAEQMISDFPVDWAKFCEDNGIIHPTKEDEIDFYLFTIPEDK